MAVINWTVSPTNASAWMLAASNAIGTADGWTLEEVPTYLASGYTVLRAPGGWVYWMYLAYGSTSTLYVGAAEDYVAGSGFIRPTAPASTAAVPAAVYADGSWHGDAFVPTPTSYPCFTPVSGTSTTFPTDAGTSAIVLDDGIYFQTGFGAFTFDTALATPADDPFPLVAFSGSQCQPTRMPYYWDLASPVAWGEVGAIDAWVSAPLTTSPDPYNTDNPSALNFTYTCVTSGAVVGGVLRGYTASLLYSGGGVAGEEVLIPDVGTYRKLNSGFWVKTGA